MPTSSALAPALSAAPVPVVGAPARWARDVGALGVALSLGALAPVMLALGWLGAPVVGLLLIGGGTGALGGALVPAALERMRGRVRLPVLFAGFGTAGAAWGLASGAIASFEMSLFVWISVAVFGAGALLVGPPLLVAAVLRRPTLPIAIGGGLGVGFAVGELAMWAISQPWALAMLHGV